MHRRTIVVIEDEPLIRLAATHLFETAGIAVVEFSTGDAAVDYVRDHKDDVAAIFTDVYLPGDMDGLELAELVAEVCPDITVLVTSARFHERPPALHAKVRFLAKPWRPDDVLATMQGVLEAA